MPPFAIGALLFAGIAVALIGLVRGTTRVKEDAAIGVVFTTLFALGVVLISKNPSQVDLHHVLFGNLLGLAATDVWQVSLLAAAVFGVLVVKRRDLTLFAFDRVQAHTLGISPRTTVGTAAGAAGRDDRVGHSGGRGDSRRRRADHPGRHRVPAHRPDLPDADPRAGSRGRVVDRRCVHELLLRRVHRRCRGSHAGAVFAIAYLFAPRQGVVTAVLRRSRAASAEVIPQ